MQAKFDLNILCAIVAGLDVALCAKIFLCLNLGLHLDVSICRPANPYNTSCVLHPSADMQCTA